MQIEHTKNFFIEKTCNSMSTYDAIDENVVNEKNDEKNRHLCESIKKR